MGASSCKTSGVVEPKRQQQQPQQQQQTTVADPDPVTGLTANDKQHIKRSWALIVASADDKTKNGVELLIQLLSAYPYMADYFQAFKDTPPDKLRINPAFNKHATNVMEAIQAEVDNMDNTDALVKIITELAQAHFALNVRLNEFENLKQMFVPFLKSIVGTVCTDEVAASWTKLLTAQNSVIKMVEQQEEANK